jgi:hypothetical protein
MNRLLFPIFAVFVLWWLNALFLWHTLSYFWMKTWGPRFYLISAIMSLIFPVAMTLHNVAPNIVTRFFYIIWALWLWVVFLWLFVWLIFDVWFYFWKSQNPIKWYIWIAAMIALTAYWYYNQAVLAVKNVDIRVKNLEKEIRIWYLSDVHIDWIHDIWYLDDIITTLNNQDIDLVLINWDMVDGTSFEKHSFKNLDTLKVPVYITFWNHESYIGKDYALWLFKDTKARILQNEVVEFSWLQILWLEDLMWLDHSYNESKLDAILKEGLNQLRVKFS